MSMQRSVSLLCWIPLLAACGETPVLYQAEEPQAFEALPEAPETDVAFRTCDPELRIDEGGCSALVVEDLEDDVPSLYVVDGESGYAARLVKLSGTFPTAGQVAVSPNGHEIAYVTYESGWQLYRMDLWTQEPQHLVTLVGGTQPGQPTWSPDGKSLAFVSYDVGGAKWEISIVDLDGNVRSIDAFTVTGSDIPRVRPTFSPNGESLAYAAFLGAEGVLRIANVATGAVQTVFDPPGAVPLQRPVYDRSGEYLAVTYLAEDAWVVGRFDVRTREIETLLELALDAQPQVQWSPTDDTLAYLDVMTDDSAIALSVLTSELDSNTLDVVGPTFAAGHPAWSPDGSRVAYIRATDEGAAELVTVRVEDGPRKVLRQQAGPTRVGRPQWLGRRTYAD
jgi:hypothetical protein